MELLVPDSVIFEHPDLAIGQLARLAGYAEELLKNKEFLTSKMNLENNILTWGTEGAILQLPDFLGRSWCAWLHTATCSPL